MGGSWIRQPSPIDRHRGKTSGTATGPTGSSRVKPRYMATCVSVTVMAGDTWTLWTTTSSK
ncbi:MAG: hypothetical protein DMD95_15040 [Candidatus Rokuibacteriota bacterium]|nr:MAG: hypothetical protein DMD95_15040 [Candidatus Rokubacteria bacterium]